MQSVWYGRHGQSGRVASKAIDRAAHALAAPVKHVRVDHGRTHILVSKQLLDGAGVVARLEQVGGPQTAQPDD